MNADIIIGIVIGSISGLLITTVVVLAYAYCKRNADLRKVGNDVEKNEHSLSQETASTSSGTEGDYLVQVSGDADTISTLTRSIPTGMDITCEILAKDWKNTEQVHKGTNSLSKQHSPLNASKNKVIGGDRDIESVGTLKINNCSNYPKLGHVGKDDFSIATEKVNNCKVVVKTHEKTRVSSSYLTGSMLDRHNEKLRSEI